MITHSGVIAGVLIVDAMALLLYNVSGMCVTGHLGAVFRQAPEVAAIFAGAHAQTSCVLGCVSELVLLASPGMRMRMRTLNQTPATVADADGRIPPCCPQDHPHPVCLAG